MKGPSLHLDLDILRRWQCPLCARVVRTKGLFTSHTCLCSQSPVFMKLLDTPPERRFDLQPFIDAVEAVPDDPIEEEEDEPQELPARSTDDSLPRTAPGSVRLDVEADAQLVDGFGTGLDDHRRRDLSETETEAIYTETSTADELAEDLTRFPAAETADSENIAAPRDATSTSPHSGEGTRKRGRRRRDRRPRRDQAGDLQRPPGSVAESAPSSTADAFSHERHDERTTEQGPSTPQQSASSPREATGKRKKSRSRRRGGRRREAGQADGGTAAPDAT